MSPSTRSLLKKNGTGSCAVFLALLALPLQATVVLPNLFGNNMILQRNQPVHIWGTANPGEPVTVTFNSQTAVTQGDSFSKWALDLPSMPANATGQVLAIQGPSNNVSLSNVVVGDIYLCSGQSNMWFPLMTVGNGSVTTGPADAAAANFPNLRMMNVPMGISATPKSDIDYSPWFSATSANQATLLNFSGLAFYCGRDLVQTEPSVPIGMLQSTYYGMPAEVFMSRESILADPALAAAAAPLSGAFDTTYDSSYPTGVYNYMIAPLTPFRVRAVLWDQGETNQDTTNSGTGPHGWVASNQYKTLMPELIKDWRMKWNAMLPVFQVQLQNISDLTSGGAYNPWSGPTTTLSTVGLADVRWGQLETLRVPLTGMSVNIDLNPNAMNSDSTLSYHPPNKYDFADRLIPWVHRVVYAESNPLTFTGPLYQSYQTGGSTVTIHFTLPNGGSLSTNNSQAVTGIQVAPAGSTNYVFAPATIVGNDLVVDGSTVGISNPGTVRYAWSQNPVDPNGPVANLSDSFGWMASPFMTYDLSNMVVASSGVTVPDLNLTPLVSDGTDFGTQGFNQPVTHTFTIANDASATAPLTLTGGVGNYVRLSGPQQTDFTVTQPAVNVLAPGSTTTFQVVFQEYPFEGLRQALLQIPCNTPSKTPYTIYLQGTILNNWTPTQTPTGTWFTSTPTNTITYTMTYTPSPTPAIAVTMIDDFEDTSRGTGTPNGRTNLWGGTWGLYDDIKGSAVSGAFLSPGASSSSSAVSLFGTIVASGYSNYLCCLLGPCTAYDAGAAGQTGLEFWMYGDGHQYRAQIRKASVTDSDNYGKTLTPPIGTWTFYQIPFTDMTREGWGSQTGLPTNPTLNDVTGIQFDTKFTGAFYYLLDQITFYKVLPTYTPTFSPTPTITPTPTGTWFTSTPTKTYTPTVTPTPTFTRTFTPTITFTPTLTFTPTGTWFTATFTSTPPPDTALYPWENGTTMGWTNLWQGVTAVSNATGTAHLGTHSLQLSVSFTGGTDGEVSVTPPSVANFTGGKTLVAWLYVPVGFPAGSTADIFIKTGSGWTWANGAGVTLVAGAWNQIAMDPANPSYAAGALDLTAIMALGVQVIPAANWTGSLYLDSVDVITPGGTSTPTPTRTSTATPTQTVNVSPGTPTNTYSPTPPASLSPTPTASFTSTPTATPTATVTPTSTRTYTWTPSPTPTFTNSPIPTSTFTWTLTYTATWTPTITNTPTITDTPTVTNTPEPGEDLPYPNPGTGGVTFLHSLTTDADQVILKVFTLDFRKIYEDGTLATQAGQHLYALDWSRAKGTPSYGLYYLVLVEKRDGTETRKVMKILYGDFKPY